MSAEEADLAFESADSGASTTFPMQAGLIRKGGHIVIKGRPCKVRGLEGDDKAGTGRLVEARALWELRLAARVPVLVLGQSGWLS